MYRHAGVDLFLGDDFAGRGLGTEVVRVVCAHLIDERLNDVQAQSHPGYRIRIEQHVRGRPVGRHPDRAVPWALLHRDLVAERGDQGVAIGRREATELDVGALARTAATWADALGMKTARKPSR